MTTNQRSHTMTDQYRTVVQAIGKLTTQVRRVADALVVPQTTGYQPVGHVPEPTTTPVTPSPVTETTTGDAQPLTVRRIAHWGPPCETGRHPAHANQTCQEMEANVALVQEWAQHAADRSRRQETRRLAASVQGRCPACGGTSLFLGEGGYVTCPRDTCPEPDAASTLLETGSIEHERLAAELARIRRALDPDDEVYIRETVDDQLALQAKVQEQQAIIDRVRARHTRVTVRTTAGAQDACDGCEVDSMSYPWPCPTAEALDPTP